MYKDIPIALVCITEDECYDIALVSEDKNLYPFEMRFLNPLLGFRKFIENRITPRSRQGLFDAMEKYRLYEYCISDLLILFNGRCCADNYWIRFEDGPQTWKDVWEVIGVKVGEVCGIEGTS